MSLNYVMLVIGISLCLCLELISGDESLGCHLATNVSVESCFGLDSTRSLIDNSVTSQLPSSAMCTISIGTSKKNLVCLDNGQIADVALRAREKREFGDMTEFGAGIGGAFGPVGAAVGAGIGFVGDVLCMFFCDKKSPPPNSPPVLNCPTLSSNTFVAQNKTTKAAVTWSPPEATDKEDDKLQISVSPNYKSGTQFSEGYHMVNFRAVDSGGMSASCFIAFEVKVTRCYPPQRPDNGYLEYDSLIYGSSYTVACKDGYQLHSGDISPIMCGKSGRWSRHVPDCAPKECLPAPTIANGTIVCPYGKAVYGAMCQIVCDIGYRIQGLFFVNCDKQGKWDAVGRCNDVTSPRFDSGSCPNDIRLNIDSSNNTALVTWNVPTGSDNSGKIPIIKEIHDKKPNMAYPAGSHTVKYTITDSSGNKGDSCLFSIQVATISCQPPNLNVPGNEHMMYDCPQLYRLGAKCSLSCRSGYPLGGVNKISCLNDGGSYPPVLHWRWDKSGLEPFCKVTACPDLEAPSNGALACSLWNHGDMCQLQCQKGFDVPRLNTAMYVCGQSDGKWRPDGNVPNCNPVVNSHALHLPSDVYYYTDKCNSSAANLRQIQDNFVTALAASQFRESCVGVPECKAEFVNITCGTITARRKRDTANIYKRAVPSLAYTITFEFSMPFSQDIRAIDDIFSEKEVIFYDMVDIVQKEMTSGLFNLGISDIHLESDSFGPGNVEFVCSKGAIQNRDKGSCNGCPTGRYYDELTDGCEYCPIGTYQDEPNSLHCKRCPTDSNTTDIGSTNKAKCLGYCLPGQWSSNGLQPCAICDSSSYQSVGGQTSCLSCRQGLKTIDEGATQKSSCTAFDIQTKGSAAFESNSSHTSISVSSWILFRGHNGNPLFRIQATDYTMIYQISNEDTVTIDIAGKKIDTGYTIKSMSWFHLGLTIETNRIILYVNGDKVLEDSSITLPRSHVLQNGDWLVIGGDLTVSSFYVIAPPLSDGDIKTLSQSCTANASKYLYNIEHLTKSENASLTIPSQCDAIDECKSSPCGDHSDECINGKNGYTCVCKDNYSGQNCNIKRNFCDNDECKNGGTCVDGLTNYTCDCMHGFHGDLCEIKAVDGQWSEWSSWTDCSVTCNGGLSERQRRCDSPSPDLDGRNCSGHAFETQICSAEKCPECSTLHRTFGLMITCNETEEIQRCTVACRPGLYFAKPALPYYECGRTTNYKWNHQNDDNPRGRLPSCSTVKPPTNLAVTLDGHYDNLDCTSNNINTAIQALEIKLLSLDCVQSGLCKSEVVGKTCGTRKRRTDMHSTTVTIQLSSDVSVNISGLSFQELLTNKTGPSSDMVDLVNQIMQMDKTVQSIFNNSVNFFEVTIDGTQHTISARSNGLIVTPTVRCPPGSVQIDVLCAECPVGSYADGENVFLCPKGQFQDEPGRFSCKMCPSGQTTEGVGTVYMAECVEKGGNNKPKDDGSSNSHTTVIVAVTVSLAVTICCVVGIVFVYKFLKKRMNRRKIDTSMHPVVGLSPPPYNFEVTENMQAKHPIN